MYLLLPLTRKHAMEVLKLLNIQDLFDGIVFVDVAIPNLIAKPDPQAYAAAAELIGRRDPSTIYFVDDNVEYVKAAKAAGWNAIVLNLRGLSSDDPGSVDQIASLQELPAQFPKLFDCRSDSSQNSYL